MSISNNGQIFNCAEHPPMDTGKWPHGPHGTTFPAWHQQPLHGHQFLYPVPFSFVIPQFTSSLWLPCESLTSPSLSSKDESLLKLPANRKKPLRRHSDPGPCAKKCLEAIENVCRSSTGAATLFKSVNECNYNGSSFWIDEAKKDSVFNSLLCELRSARNLNRQLFLELHKAKMEVYKTHHQQANDYQPGSVAALVRKLYKTHHRQPEGWSSPWNSHDDIIGDIGSNARRIGSIDIEDVIKEMEVLKDRLQATTKKLNILQNLQRSEMADNCRFKQQSQSQEARSTLCSISSTGCLSPSKTTHIHQPDMDSLSASGPASLEHLEDSDASFCKQYDVNSSNSARPYVFQRGQPLMETAKTPSSTGGGGPTPETLGVQGITLKRDLELQLASVERDRRYLEHQLQDSIGTRRNSEDRIMKLERLVAVLRKKLEIQPSMPSAQTGNFTLPPASIGNARRLGNIHHRADASEYSVEYQVSSRMNQSPSADGPASLPSYLRVVGPITQL